LAALIEYEIMGFPQKGTIFFPGIRLLPPRAGIIAIRIGSSIKIQVIVFRAPPSTAIQVPVM
jgi:hypothetical protein